jgi:chromate transporter
MTNPHPPPKSPLDLFISFTLIAIQGFGGVMAIIQRELVEKKQWMTKEEFIEEWAVAQIMPGPNVINLTLMLGSRYFGLRGALAALAGMLLAPLIIVLTLGMLYSEFSTHPGVAGATRGMSAVAAGFIIATGIKLFAGLKSNPLGKMKCIAFGVTCFVCIALLRWPMLSVLILLGPLACLIAYRGLKP